MVNVRRWYTYLVCAISLQSVVWAIIALLRNLLQTSGRIIPASVAFQIAVIVVGLPMFLAHWLWVQRLAHQDQNELASDIRRLYLYSMKTAFLWPLVAQAYYLLRSLIPTDDSFTSGSPELHHLLPILVLGIFWFYHYRILKAETALQPLSETAGIFRRLYFLAFSLGGLVVFWDSSHQLLKWALQRVVRPVPPLRWEAMMYFSLAAVLVGLLLWLIFWRRAQKLYQSGGEEEIFSALRKFYLYGLVFTGAMFTVGSLVVLLAGFIRRLLGLAPSEQGAGDLLPLIFISGIVWAYHAYTLRKDGQKAEEAPRQVGIRRLYYYLIAAIGLSTFLSGISVILMVLIRLLGSGIFGNELKEMLAVSTAGLIAGLPVWLLPWRPAQQLAAVHGLTGRDERRSTVRKIYLYFFLFASTIMVLSSLVFIIYRVVGMALGETRPTFMELGQAISFTIIGSVVWLYHISLIRQDSRLLKEDIEQRASILRAAIIVDGEGVKEFMKGLQREIPGLLVNPISLQPSAESAALSATELSACLQQNELVLVPLGAVLEGSIGSVLAASPVRKLLLPFAEAGWELVGIAYPPPGALVKQTALALRQMMAGEKVQPHKPLGVGAIVGIVLAVIFLLTVLVPLGISLVIEFF